MYIRSQNKAILLIVDTFTIDKRAEDFAISTYGYLLGTYKTEERALEVLNDIQEQIILKHNFYIMPKEW